MMIEKLEKLIGKKKTELLKELLWVDSKIKEDCDEGIFYSEQYKILYRELMDGLNMEQEDLVDETIDKYSHMEIDERY